MKKRDGSGDTPNIMIPLNNRAPGEIADIAWQQLKPYAEAAATWPIHETIRDGRICNVCRLCKQNIWFKYDEDGQPYKYSYAELQPLLVAHIRQCHTDDNGVIDEASGECEILDNPSRAYPPCVYNRDAGRHLNQDGYTGASEQDTTDVA
jgi:hypothetical protein